MLPIEKRSFLSGMDGDTDPKLLDDKSSLNLMNCRMAVTEYGRTGRIENIPGTTLVSQQVYPPYGTSQTIGTAIDFDNGRLLFFNYNTFEDHAIYCYDPYANNNAGYIYAVLYDSQVTGGLGFSRDSLIHSARVENGCLYWCDSTNNEPRRININAGIAMNHAGVYPDVSPYEYPMSQSVLYWIRRQPGLPLSGEKSTDATYENNFIKNEAFQFGWRYIYRDYETSTLSAWSLLFNYNTADDNSNLITVTAPLDETIQQDVLQVDLVVRYVVGGKCFVIKSWNKNITADRNAIIAHNSGSQALTFDFYNDITGIALDDAYSVKPFDSLPIYAQTIEMARFRSFMANYVIGYDTPTETSLTGQASIVDSTGSLLGQWWAFYYWVDGSHDVSSLVYVLYLNQLGAGQDGYYFFTGSPSPTPPLPTSVDFADFQYMGADLTSVYEFFGIASTDVIFFYGYGGFTVTVTNGPTPIGLDGFVTLKTGASYQLAIHFLDHAGRKCGILTNDGLKINISERSYDQLTYTTAINWALSNVSAISEIPDWAYYYSIDITKCLTMRFFEQSRAKNITYATKDQDGNYVFNSSAYATTRNGIGIDITLLNAYGMGYTFSEGDLVKVWISGDSTVYNLAIIAQDGNWIVCELKNLGTLGDTAVPKTNSLFQIYTPYKASASEPFYEEAQIFPVANPTTDSRTYSTVSGTITGDVTILTRNDGTNDYLTENMSPNDKFPYNWNTDAGRPTFVDSIGQVTKTNSIAYSNTLIQGTKTNGLSTYDALDVKDVSKECGDITKLQVANKISDEQGTIMLAICQNETASCYLGEVQLVGATQNAFIAQAPEVIGTVNILQGSFGTTKPESVVEYLGLVFFIDLRNGTPVQYSNAGLEPVGRYKMARFFKNYCRDYLASNSNNLDNINGFNHIRFSVDPFHKELICTLPALIYENYADVLPSYSSVPSYATSIINRFDIYDQLGKTMAFSFEENKWGSNFEYGSEWTEYMENILYGFKNGNLYIHNDDTTNWNKFYGVNYPIRICSTANINASQLKDLANIAVESNAVPDYSVAMATYPNEQITDLASDDYSDDEGNFYATWFCDRLSPNASGTADQKMYSGDQITDKVIFWMLEFQSYDELNFINFVDIGWQESKGQRAIANPVNT